MPHNAVHNGVVTVVTPGTAVVLAASSRTVVSVLVVALATNTGIVAVGGTEGANVAGSIGVKLAAGDAVPFGAVDLHELHLDAAVAGEGIAFLTEE